MQAARGCGWVMGVVGLVAALLVGLVPSAQAVDLFVSSFVSDDVKRYNGTTGAFMASFASGGGLNGPEGLGFGPDGHLYVSSSSTDDVKRYNGTTGAFIDTFASGGGLSPTFLTFAPTVVPEPGTVTLLGLGLAGLVVAVRRRRQ